jgi:NAD(P)-dependent dehydrogenase (short-subunit alcohol dehydrogenase family)
MSALDRLRPQPGLRVLVTAGAAGIGAVVADAFRDAGARVAVGDLDADALAAFAAARPDVHAIAADVARDADVLRLVAGAAERLGGLDVLVNNAGIAGPTAAVEAIDPADWRRTLDVNITGMFLVTRAAVPHLRAAAAGSIINLASVAGRLGYAFRTPYAASKWAVVGFTQSLAKELGPAGLRANAILPGLVEGPRIERVIAARAAATGQPVDTVRAGMLAQISLRRAVPPDDVAAMALFLCSPGGATVTGQALSVCAGVETI